MGAVLLIVVGGFLGAGKTTALTWLAQSLEALGKRTAVVMNDQGELLVDSALGRSFGLTIAEVTGGCFCCRFDELAAKTISLVEQQAVEVVLAEAVGSCTDLSATVIRPLRAHFGERFAVAPLTVLVDPARLRELQVADDSMSARMRYLFDKQLEDACTLVLTKQDLVAPADHAPLVKALEGQFPSAEVLSISAATGQGMVALQERLLAVSRDGTSQPGVRSIDYKTYAEAEAELAWLNAQVAIQPATPGDSVTSVEWLRNLCAELSERCARQGLWVGHIKAHLATSTGDSKASVLQAGAKPIFDLEAAQPFASARLLVNARVRAQPAELDALVRATLARVDERLGTTCTVESLRAFSPLPPRPTHRLELSRS
jgi:G3E family GTPase